MLYAGSAREVSGKCTFCGQEVQLPGHVLHTKCTLPGTISPTSHDSEFVDFFENSDFSDFVEF